MSSRAPLPESASADAVTELILRIFRVNGQLLLAGDQLVGPLGLTSARWQVLGGIAAAETPHPVVRIAREMGVSRQAVQRITNELSREGIVQFEANPKHKRAQLVKFTDRGRDLYEKALAVQRPWATGLADGLSCEQVEAASSALDLIREQLDRRRPLIGGQRERTADA